MLTEKQAAVLRALVEWPHSSPGWIAEQVWPDSPSWRRPAKCGRKGVSRGKAIKQVAGRVLNGLQRRGLARNAYDVQTRRHTGWVITYAGEMMLKDAIPPQTEKRDG